MANEARNGNGAPAQQGPQIRALGQYIKDFSFENPNAPRSLQPQTTSPPINVQVNVNAKQLAPNDFEIELKLEGGAGEGANVLFNFELSYCGVFQLVDIPEQQKHPVVMIECPRLLFPFARQIVADAVSNGGFPPFLLNPIDFGALYQQRMQEQNATASTVVS
ncbi:MAG: protein-export chaperone SecB [Rhizobiales bacterium 65-9]|nr:protein-export chaperone SecB [Hyphomicrobiales bacterium]OJY34603.1 MAG: protein-export chaperone SecB [Rhizobiales bacterium 65-9]